MSPQRSPNLRLLSSSRPASVDALIEQAEGAEKEGRRDLARQLYDRALYRLGDRPEEALASRILLSVARTHQSDSNHGTALDCLEAALAVADAWDDGAAKANAAHLRAAIYFEQGDLVAAEREYGEARARAAAAGDGRLAALIAQDLGACASARRDLYSALRHHESSLAELRSLGTPADLSVALGGVGRLYTDLQHWEAAERAYGEGIEISRALGDLTGVVRGEMQLAEMWVERRSFENARQACERARDISRGIRDMHLHGSALKVYGIISREMGEFAKAEEQFAQAERIAQGHTDLLLAADTARERADLYARQGKHLETLQALNRAYRFLSQLRARRDLPDVARRVGRLEREFLGVVTRWGQSIESKDSHTRGHCERMAGIACAIATRMDFDRRALFWFRIGAILHDVGKLIIPPDLLNKPGRLTPEEWAIIRRHPAAGAEMLAGIDFPWDVRPIVESHHECWDGSGYPHGLAGEQIPLAARIVCVADVYDALTTDRSFKAALTPAEAIDVMRRDVGRQFDPAVFRVLEELVRDRDALPRMPGERTLSGSAATATPPSVSTRRIVDELTGVLQRGALMNAIARALDARQGDQTRAIGIVIVDLDHFRRVNDAYGQRQGDEVLRSVAELLSTTVREGDVVGRYAGDEFVLLLHDARLEDAQYVGERVRSAVERLRCSVTGSNDVVAVTVSVGVAAAPVNGDAPNALIAAADRALFSAKRRGGNAVSAADVSVDDSPRSALPLDRFIGRVEELRRLVSLVERVTRGEPQIVALVGEAGVGKSSLLTEMAPEIRLRAGTMVFGRSLEEAKTPYRAWSEILLALHSLGALPARHWEELPRLVPVLAPDGSTRDGAFRPRAQGNKYLLFDEIVDTLRAAAASAPLALVLEDAQWADAATWELLEYLLTRLERDRILICLTIRAEGAREIADRRRRLAADPRFVQIALRRLTADELKRWIEDVFHQGAIENDFPSFLHAYTEGNPLHVVQALRALHEEGGIWYAGTRWEWRPISELHLPPAFADLLARRLERLSPRARSILAAASVIGSTIDPALVIATGAGSESEVRGAIDEGVAAGVLEPLRDRDHGRFRFSHALLGDAVRRWIGGRELQRLHERTAHALELRAPTAVAEIAAHYHAAGNDARAYRYALLASERAASVYAHDEATSFLLVAQRHAPGPKELAEARVRLARVAESAGRYELAEEMCDLSLDWYGHRENGRESLPILRLREHLRALRGDPPQRLLESGRLLLAEAEGLADRRERAALLVMLSRIHARLADWLAAERCARSAVGLASSHDDRRLHADALTALGVVLLETKPREALEYFNSALAVFTNVDDRYGQTRCWINAGDAHGRSGKVAEALEAYTVALEMGRGAHAPDLAGSAALQLGVMHGRTGAYEMAQERLEEAVRLFTAVRNEPLRLTTMYNVAHLARERGDPRSALSLYESTGTAATRMGQSDIEIGSLAGAGLAFLDLGDRDGAEQRYRNAALLVGDRKGWWFQGREMVEALGVRVSLLGGHAGLAAQEFVDALSLAQRHDSYAAAWLVAHCAQPLADAGIGAVGASVARFAKEAEAQRFTPLAVRLNAFLARSRAAGGA